MKKIAWWFMTTLSATTLLLAYPTSHPTHDQPAVVAQGNKAGTFTGNTVSTKYGPVQVEITTQDGQITSAQAIQYPNSNGRDQMINSRAIPLLNDQATTGAVDTVSGATYTSRGYEQSLQAALDQAGL